MRATTHILEVPGPSPPRPRPRPLRRSRCTCCCWCRSWRQGCWCSCPGSRRSRSFPAFQWRLRWAGRSWRGWSWRRGASQYCSSPPPVWCRPCSSGRRAADQSRIRSSECIPGWSLSSTGHSRLGLCTEHCQSSTNQITVSWWISTNNN